MDWFNWQQFLLLAVVFVPIERLFAMHPEQKILRRGFANDLVYVAVNGLLIKGGTIVILVAATAALQPLVPAAWRAAVAGQPLWLQAVEVLVIADLGFYAVHRLFHTVPWLWRFHAVHHSIEELDWLAGHRVHPVDQILTKGATLVPCFLLGFSEWAVAAYALVYQWHSVLLHSNVRLGFGPLRWLVASPEFHHWHHSDHREAYDKNFAGQLALFDVLFGTAFLTRGRRPERYGCSDPVPATYLQQLAYPFRAAPAQAPAAAEGGEDAPRPLPRPAVP